MKAIRLRLVPAFVFAVVLSSSAACGGGPSRGVFEGNVYRNGPIAFHLPDPPPGWRRLDVEKASLAFRDDAHDASILINARCLTADDRTPLSALTNHLLIGATEREYLREAKEPIDNREALHSVLTAKWDGVPMLIDMFVLSKDGCVYDFVFMAPTRGEPPKRVPTEAEAFEELVRGFHTLHGSGVV